MNVSPFFSENIFHNKMIIVQVNTFVPKVTPLK